MKILLFGLSLLVSTSAALAGEAIVTTAVARSILGTNNALFVWLPSTNVVDIPNGQAARLVTAYPLSGLSGALYSENLQVVKNGVAWQVFRGDVIQGPAQFVLFSDGRSAGEVANGQPSIPSPYPVLMTLERWTVRKATLAQLKE